MANEGGFSWPETIIALTVVMIIFSTLLPISLTMLNGLHSKKMEMHAKETMYQASLLYKKYGLSSGERKEDGLVFTWEITGTSLCVTYVNKKTVKEVCSP